MSHFVTLVNFYMPKLEENCEENMRYAEQLADVKEKLAQDPESFALRFLLKRLQSKASTLERSAECEIDELMAPFCEGTDDPVRWSLRIEPMTCGGIMRPTKSTVSVFRTELSFRSTAGWCAKNISSKMARCFRKRPDTSAMRSARRKRKRCAHLWDIR